MIKQVVLALAGLLLIAAFGESAELDKADAVAPAPTNSSRYVPEPRQAKRGGSIRVGDQTWTIVPSVQCGVYPGGIVSIAGHAESDSSLEIVIDVDPNGPIGVRIGRERGGVSWNAVRETLKIEISGKQVRGTATFSVYGGGAGERAAGEFRVDC